MTLHNALWHNAMLPAIRAALVMSNQLYSLYDETIFVLFHAEAGMLAVRLQGKQK